MTGVLVVLAFSIGFVCGAPAMAKLLIRGQRVVGDCRRVMGRLEAENVELRLENERLRRFVATVDAICDEHTTPRLEV